MKVKEFIEQLQKFDPEMDVSITDGRNSISYEGDFRFATFNEFNGVKMVDIGIGGLNV